MQPGAARFRGVDAEGPKKLARMSFFKPILRKPVSTKVGNTLRATRPPEPVTMATLISLPGQVLLFLFASSVEYAERVQSKTLT